MKRREHQPSDFARRLGSAMRSLRTKSGLSQKVVASRMGFKASSAPLIVRYENGQQLPRADLLYRYLTAVDSSFSALGALFDRALARPSAPSVQDLLEELARLSIAKP